VAKLQLRHQTFNPQSVKGDERESKNIFYKTIPKNIFFGFGKLSAKSFWLELFFENIFFGLESCLQT
jgi:hypothetical protein